MNQDGVPLSNRLPKQMALHLFLPKESSRESDYPCLVVGRGFGRLCPAVTPSATAIPTPDLERWTPKFDLIAEKLPAGVFDGSILVARNGQVILGQGYGFADRSKQTPNTAQTKFLIGSITKQFTAMAILLLQAQGKLNVQDRTLRFSHCPEIFKPVTLYHLLTMSSGIPNSTRWDLPGDKTAFKICDALRSAR